MQKINLVTNEISIVWTIEDVKTVYETLTNEQAREVLRLCESEHDADVGINWGVIEYWVGQVLAGSNKPLNKWRDDVRQGRVDI